MASLPADTAWEVNTTGSDTAAGGGFSTANKGATGTDLTYPTPTITTFTSNLSAVGTTTLTCSAALFTNTMLGNVIQISGQGFFCITGFTSTTIVTVHTAMGTFATTSGWVGGALASPGQAAANRVSGNTVWIKSGTYSITSASTNVAAGCISDTTGGDVVTWEGYQTTRGDLGTAPILQASGISTFTLLAVTSAATAGYLIRNLVLDGNSRTASQGFSNARRGMIYLVTAKNCTNIGFTSSAICVFLRCLATNITGGTAAFSGTFQAVYCEAASGTVTGFSFAANNCGGIFCLSHDNSGTSDGFIFSSGEGYCVSCVSATNGRDGYRFAFGEAQFVASSIAESNVGSGFNAPTSAPSSTMLNNAVYGNGTNVNANVTGANIGLVTGTGSFFVSVGTNFALNATAGAGAAARAAGFPGAFPAGTTTGYHDIGAAQHADPVKLLTTMGMTGGME